MLAIILATLLGAANLQAAEYDLWICGVQVTDANKNNLVAAINGVSGCSATGSIKYISETRTLAFDNGVINVNIAVEAGVVSCIETLNITLKGTNNAINMENTESVGMSFYSSVIFRNSSGDYAKLTVNANKADSRAIVIKNATCAIYECGINANGNTSGINVGWDSTYADLIIAGADVTATGSEGCISGFDAITLSHSVISEPEGAKISADNSSVVDASGNIITGTVKITRSGVTTYPILIAGKSITNVNKDKIDELFDGVTGTVTYNPDNKTLKLDDATITTSGSICCILSRVDGMIIEVYHTNTLTGNGWSPIAYEDNNSGTIQGSGTLNISNANPNDGAIFMRNGSLTIKNCTINATGGKNTITGGSGEKTLTFENTTVTASLNTNGAKEGTIVGFKAINFNNSLISQPAGAVFNATKKAICDASGNIIKETVKIVPGYIYDLTICGVNVTSLNKDNLSVIPGVTGTAKYNPGTKTLTLNGSAINKPDGANAFKSNIEGLTIDVQGNNSVNSDGWATMRFEKPATIKGGGTLNVSHTKDGWALFTYNASLNIENCTVNVTSATGRAITGNNIGTLTINNATVTAKGPAGSVTHFADIILNDCAITEPVGARVSKGADTYYAVRDASGNIITETVKIVPATVYNLLICGVTVTSLNKDNLSTISGVTAGTVNYNPTSNTLTLNGATIAATGNVCCILSRIDNLIINVVGINNLSGDGWTPIAYEDENSGTIQGTGTLNINNTNKNDAAIYMKNGSLTIKNCTLNATGGKNAIYGNSGEKTLSFDNATVTASLNADGTKEGTIKGFNAINFINSFMAHPHNAVFNTTEKAICYPDGTIVKEEVKIMPGTFYNLYVCGAPVTSLNKDNLTNIPGVTGKVNYNPTTKTLKLEDATITATGSSYGIFNKKDNVKIELVGKNTIKSNASAIVFENTDFEERVSINGNDTGTLNVSSTNEAAIKTNIMLDIKHCTLTATGKTGAFKGNLNYFPQLTFQNVTASATGTDVGTIVDVSNVFFRDCKITQPEGAYHDFNKKAYCNTDGSIIKTEIKIEPEYNLLICNVPITPLNKRDLSVISGVTGTVSYDPVTKILKLDGATIAAKEDDFSGIYSRTDSLKVALIGNNKVTCLGNYGMDLSSGIIEGGGTLSVSGGYAAISTSRSLTIKNCTITATGMSYGIDGRNILTINNASVSAKGDYSASLYGFNEVNLTGCVITRPANAVFIPDKQAVCYPDSTIVKKEEVKIEKIANYDLTICGKQVTTLNANDLSVISGVTGKVSYNSDTRTLRLENATINSTTTGITTEKGGLKIELVGNNTITSSSTAVFFNNTNGQESGSIKGSGTLNINSTNGTVIDIAVPLTIENCTVTASGKLSGIAGKNGNLTIENATVSATGTNAGSIIGFSGLNFIGCGISQPAGAVFNPTNKAVCYADGTIVKETVKITSKGTDLDELNTNAITLYPNPVQDILHIQTDEIVNTVSIYNLQGKVVAQTTSNVHEINLSHLSAGIYMVRIMIGESVSTVRIIKK